MEKIKREKLNFFVGIFSLLFTIVFLIIFGVILSDGLKRIRTPLFVADKVVSSSDELIGKLKERALILEKGRLSDSDSYKEASQMLSEAESFRNKLIELREDLKNKSWAD